MAKSLLRRIGVLGGVVIASSPLLFSVSCFGVDEKEYAMNELKRLGTIFDTISDDNIESRYQMKTLDEYAEQGYPFDHDEKIAGILGIPHEGDGGEYASMPPTIAFELLNYNKETIRVQYTVKQGKFTDALETQKEYPIEATFYNKKENISYKKSVYIKSTKPSSFEGTVLKQKSDDLLTYMQNSGSITSVQERFYYSLAEPYSRELSALAAKPLDVYPMSKLRTAAPKFFRPNFEESDPKYLINFDDEALSQILKEDATLHFRITKTDRNDVATGMVGFRLQFVLKSINSNDMFPLNFSNRFFSEVHISVKKDLTATEEIDRTHSAMNEMFRTMPGWVQGMDYFMNSTKDWNQLERYAIVNAWDKENIKGDYKDPSNPKRRNFKMILSEDGDNMIDATDIDDAYGTSFGSEAISSKLFQPKGVHVSVALGNAISSDAGNNWKIYPAHFWVRSTSIPYDRKGEFTLRSKDLRAVEVENLIARMNLLIDPYQNNPIRMTKTMDELILIDPLWSAPDAGWNAGNYTWSKLVGDTGISDIFSILNIDPKFTLTARAPIITDGATGKRVEIPIEVRVVGAQDTDRLSNRLVLLTSDYTPNPLVELK